MQTVLVNLLEFDPPRNGGVTNIVYVLSRLLVEQARLRKINVFFAVGWQTADSFRAWAGLPDAIVIPLLLAEGLTPPILKSLKPDLMISPMFGMDPIMAAIPEIAETPHIAVMPDTLSLDKPSLFDFQDVTRRRKIYNLLRQADTVVTISQDARKRLIRHLDLNPSKVKVIPLAGDLPTSEQSDAAPIIIPGPYIFYPANGWPHKRHSLLLQTMNEIWRTRPDLYLALTGWHEPEYINKMFTQYYCRWDRLVNLGYVKSHAQVQSLYRNAEALFFVSQYEGFGMPLVEAMRNDCPIICAPITSIPEVAGNAAIYVDSKDPRDWAQAFLQELPARRSELIQNGRKQADQFTWARTAQMWEFLLAEHNLFDVNLPSRADQNSVLGLSQLAPELHHWNNQHTSDIQGVAAMAQEAHTVKEFLKHPYRDYFLNRIPVLQKASLWWQGATDSFSLWTDRIWKFTHPRLGILEHYPPGPILTQPHYFIPPAQVDTANAPKISLVTPSFNQGMFLEKTITSLLEQNYPNLEYILQDGDSRDESVEIIEEYRSRFHHVESRKDKGQAQAINLGFSHATGEIMAYLNSDDFLMPGALQYVAAYFQTHPDVDVIYSHRIIVNENDEEIGRWVLPPHEDLSMLWYDFIPQETLFWRRSIWEKAGGYIDESFQFALDWDLLIRFRQAGARFTRVNRFLACFRVHGAQKTSLNMSGVGMDEINQIRQRIHGYVPSQKECDAKTASYRWKSVLYYALNRFKFLKE